MITPRQALDLAIEYGIVYDGRRGEPGAIIKKLSPEEREILSRLTSDESLGMRTYEDEEHRRLAGTRTPADNKMKYCPYCGFPLEQQEKVVDSSTEL